MRHLRNNASRPLVMSLADGTTLRLYPTATKPVSVKDELLTPQIEKLIETGVVVEAVVNKAKIRPQQSNTEGEGRD